MSYLDSLIFGVRTVLNAGVEVFQRSKINFVSGFTVVDNPITGATDVTSTAAAPSPTGTGFTHNTTGAQDAAAVKVDLLDVNHIDDTALGTALQVLRVNALATSLEYANTATGTGFTHNTAGVQDATAIKVDLTNGNQMDFATIGTALQVVRVNAGATALEYAAASAAPGANADEIITTDGAGVFQAVAGVTATLNGITTPEISIDNGTPLAQAGDVRLSESFVVNNRNGADTFDLTVIQLDTDNLWIGGDVTRTDDNGFTDLNHLCRASGAHNFYAGETVRFKVDDTNVRSNVPIVGIDGPYGVHGSASENMQDLDHQVVNKEVWTLNVSSVVANTAIRKLQFPDVATAAESYTKFVRNSNGGGFDVRVSVVTGGFTTVDIPDAFGAWVGFDDTGVYRLGANVAL